MKKRFLLLAALLALVLLAVVPASAGTITMSNPYGIASRDVLLYDHNGTLQFFGNDTSVITLDPNESYVLMLKPLRANPLEDPRDWLTTDVFPFFQTNLIYLIVIGVFIAIAIGRR